MSFVLVPMIFIGQMPIVGLDASILCPAVQATLKLTTSASILAQLLIGIDQYLAVINPLHYHRHINESRCVVMCALVWLISAALAIFCSLDQSPSYQYIADLVYLSLAFVLPILVILLIYFQIFIAARSNSIKTRRNSSCSMTQQDKGSYLLTKCLIKDKKDIFIPKLASLSSHDMTRISILWGQNILITNLISFLENSNNNETQPMYSQYLHVNSTSNSNNLSRSPSMKSTTSNLIHLTSNLRASMRSKLSHASHLILYGEESKAAKVTILVVLSILFCWAPYCIYKFSTHLNPQVNAEYFANSAFSEHFVSKHAT